MYAPNKTNPFAFKIFYSLYRIPAVLLRNAHRI